MLVRVPVVVMWVGLVFRRGVQSHFSIDQYFLCLTAGISERQRQRYVRTQFELARQSLQSDPITGRRQLNQLTCGQVQLLDRTPGVPW